MHISSGEPSEKQDTALLGDVSDAKKRAGQAHRSVRFVVLAYIFVAGWWVLFTDRMMPFFVKKVSEMEEWSIYKGFVFVFVTAILLYYLIFRLAARLMRVSESLRSSERKYRHLVEASPDAVYINRGNRIVFLNAAALRMFGALEESQIMGKSSFDLFHPSCHEAIRNRHTSIRAGLAFPLVEQKIVRLDGAILDVEVAAVPFADREGGAVLVVLRDITERKRQEEEIRRLNRLYSVLSQINQAVIRVSSRKELYGEVCRIIIDDGGFTMAVMACINRETHDVAPVVSAGKGAEALLKIVISADDDCPEGRGLVGTSIREGRTCISNDYANDPRTRPWHEIAASHGYKSAISLPIRNSKEICAVLAVYSGELNCFQSQEVKLLEEVALDISFALEHLEQETLRRAAEVAQAHSLSLLRATFQSTAEGIVVVDHEEHIIDANARFSELWHLPASLHVFENDRQLLDAMLGQLDDPEAFLARVRYLDAHPEEETFDVLKMKDGRVFERYSIPQRVDGQTVGRVLSFRDVSVRVWAEESLQKSEEQLRLLVEHLPAGVVVHDSESRVILSNPEGERLLGLTNAQMEGKAAMDGAWCFSNEKGEPLPLDQYPVNQVISSRKPLEGYILGINRGESANRIWVLVNAYPEFDAQGSLRHVVVCFVDMTERKQTLEALTESEEKFRMLFDASRDAILLLDRQSYLDCNQAALAMFGASSKDEFCSKRVGGISAPEQPDGTKSIIGVRQHIEAAYATGYGHFEWLYQRFDGTQFPAEISLGLFELKGQPVLQAVVRDISWRKKAEQQLRQLSRVVQQSPSTVVITDTKGNIQYVNPKFTAITGYTSEEAIGQNPRILKSGEIPSEEYKVLWDTITSGREWRGEFHNKKKNGEFFWESASICPITDESGAITHFLAVKEDVTERKLMEESLLRTQRMESIGSLAGGMAHDLNNILAPIMMSASLLRENHSPEFKEQLICSIEEATQRGASIVNQVLTFARGAKGERSVLSVQTLATQLGKFIKEAFPKSIAFSASFPEALWNVIGDPTQLHQVLLNLCVNARDAMPDGGTLALTAENCEVDAAHAYLNQEAKPGHYVKLIVTDSGLGIPKEAIGRIFDPFFTTKEPGKGTGLGLSTAIGIVRSHGGFVTVESAIGKGAIFCVFLPATTDATAIKEAVPQSVVPRGCGEMILIVDDEAEILNVLGAILKRNGWTVIPACDGAEALALYRKHATEIKAIMTDVVMPNMGGMGLIRAIRELDPKLPILVVSGYGNESCEEELETLGVTDYLKKPFSARQILSKMDAIFKNR